MKKLIPHVIGRALNLTSYVAPAFTGRVGFKLFCYPFRTPLKPSHHEFLNSAVKTQFSHDGNTIQVYQWGTGPKKVLLLHGWQSHSYRWKSYIEALSPEEYSIYSLDAPGHGLSTGDFLTVPVYSSVIERLMHEINEIDTVIAHSLGAFSILYTLYRLPLLQVKKVVLLAPPGTATEFIRFYQLSLGLTDRAIKHISDHFENVIGERIDYFSSVAFASNLNQRGLIIHDEGDTETSVNHAREIHSAWKKSRLKITTGLGHNLKSPTVLEDVLNFVKSSGAIDKSIPEEKSAWNH